MEDESIEFKVQTIVPKKSAVSVASSFYEDGDSEAGPEDEFRAVKISVITKKTTRDNGDVTNDYAIDITKEETRDEGDIVASDKEIYNAARITGDDERATDVEDLREEEPVTSEQRECPQEGGEEENLPAGAAADNRNEEEDDGLSVVSELTTTQTEKPQDQGPIPTSIASQSLEQSSNSSTSQEEVIARALSMQSKSVALFDGALLDEEVGDSEEDDLTVASHSKSVVDESQKNVDKAEALAKEMQRQLAESLAQFPSTPSPSMDNLGHGSRNSSSGSKEESETKEMLKSTLTPITDDVGKEERTDTGRDPNNSSAFFYSAEPKNLSLGTAILPDTSQGDNRAQMTVGDHHTSTLGSPSPSSSSSSQTTDTLPATTAVPLRRQRPSFRHRRPTTKTWATEEAGSARKTATSLSPSSQAPPPPLSQKQQQILETIVIPALFLIVAVAICRNFFHPWLKVGDGQSNTWALTWTVLCIVAVVAPVCALEYMLLSGLLAGTALQRAIQKYPEIKQFLKDVRRMRLRAGWWYPSEVRTLRKDLEATNAEILFNQQESLAREAEDDDERSLQRQMSREERHREKAHIEKLFDGERAEWLASKDKLIAEVALEKERSEQLREQLATEQQKQKMVTAQKMQLENNVQVERLLWNNTRKSLEETLKTAVESLEDNEQTTELFKNMEESRDKERALWEREREGFHKTIRQSEEESFRIQEEHEAKVQRLEDLRSTKQSEWEVERNSLKEAAKTAIDEAKAVEDELECQICQLKDARDANYERQIEELNVQVQVQQKATEELLQESSGEQKISLQCVQNLQSVLDEERAEWKAARETLEKNLRATEMDRDDSRSQLRHTEIVFEEERATWNMARRTYEDALIAANSVANTNQIDDERAKKAIQGAHNETLRLKKSLNRELRAKESKIVMLEASIQQLEKIISIQQTIEVSSNRDRNKTKISVDREADSPVAFIGNLSSTRSSRSIELSSSNVSAGEQTVASDSGSYYSWVQKVQETHTKEQRGLLCGLLTQHLRWQNANRHVGQLLASSRAMLAASDISTENSESAEIFHNSLVQYTAASISAKRYMDELVSRTGLGDLIETRPEMLPSFVLAGSTSREDCSIANHEDANEESIRSSRSVVVSSNPWLRNAPMWEQLWSSFLMAKNSPFRLCHTAVRSIYSGFLTGTGVGLGMFHVRASSKHQQLKPRELQTK